MPRYNIDNPLTDDGRNKINSMFEELYKNYTSSGYNASEAKKLASEALANAILAKDIAEDTRQELINIIRAQTSGEDVVPEVVQARGDEPVLGDRLDKFSIKLADLEKLKADFVYVDTLIASILDGGPSIFFDTYTELVNAYPHGAAGIALVKETDPAHIYIWDGEKWKDYGPYQGIEVNDRSISTKKTDFAATERTVNLANLNVDKVVNTDGTLAGAVGLYDTTDFDEVMPGDTEKITTVRRIGFYDNKYTFIKLFDPGEVVSNAQYEIPENAAFRRVSFKKGDIPKILRVIPKGDKIVIRNLEVETSQVKGPINGEQVEDKSLGAKKLDFVYEVVQVSIEKLNVGMVVNPVDGTLSGSGGFYDTTDFEAEEAGLTYKISNTRRIGFYDSSLKFLGVFDPGTLSYNVQFTTPPNTAFRRVSFATGDVPFLTPVVSDDNKKRYIAPNLEISKSQVIDLSNDREFEAFLPKEYYVAEGRTIELYNKQVSWCGNINNFHFKWSCQVGEALKRKFSVAGVADKLGQYPATLIVYDNNMNEIWRKTTQVKMVANTLSGPVKVLALGDSLTNGKLWLEEVRRLSNGMITFVGTRGTAPLQHEGRSGFSAADYLAPTEYTYENEGVQPFWDPTLGRFSWQYYKDTTGINPDAIQIFLGTNNDGLDPVKNAENIKKIIDYIRLDDLTIPIYVVNTLYRSDQDGIGVQRSTDGYSLNQGQWKLQEDWKVFKLMQSLHEMLSSYSKLYFVPVALTHDSEYNFGAVETPVNPRAIQKEPRPIDSVHPQDQGYLQFADSIFSTYVGTFPLAFAG